MLKKNFLSAYLIGVALFMIYGACKAQPNTVIGCVEVPGAFFATCGFSNPFGIAITPDGKKAYVSNSNSNTVSVIDVASDTVIGCVNVPYAYAGTCGFDNPLGIAITPDGTKAYVCNSASTTVSIINVASDTVIGCVDVPYAYAATCGFDGPYGIVITPNGITPSKAYVTNSNSDTVSVIDVASDTVIACVEVPYAYAGTCPISKPQGIAITPNGKKVYIINFDATAAGSVETVIDVATDSVIGCIETPYAYTSCEFDRPQAMAITPDGTKGYITNSGFLHNSVSIIDVASDSVIGCVEVPYAYDATCGFQAPQGITITSDGTTAYVTNFDGNSVSIIDVASDTVIGCVDVPYAYAATCGFSGPASIVITPDGTKAYVVNNGGNSVSVIEIKASALPPASVSGCKTRNRFLLQTDFINNITWTAPASGTPVAYKIYRDPALTQLVATVPANGPLQYYDHDRNPGIVYSYYIVSVDGNGNQSTANGVTVTNPC